MIPSFANKITVAILAGHQARRLPPLKDFIEPLGLTRYRVAKAIGVPQRRIDEVCSGRRAMSADTAIRLGRYLGVEPQLWMNLQSQYDLEIAETGLRADSGLEIIPLENAAQGHSERW